MLLSRDGATCGDGKVTNFSNYKIQFDIANWSSREPYETFPNIERKIRGRLQRKYKLKVDSKILDEKIKNYREIYDIIKENLPKYISPSESGYAEPKYVKNNEIKEFLTKRFPIEDKKILESIIGWVIYYEYLR